MEVRVVKYGNFWVGEVYGDWVHMKDGRPAGYWTGWKRITAKFASKNKAEEELTRRLMLKRRMERASDGKK